MTLCEGKYINGEQFVKDVETVFRKENIEPRDYKSFYYRYFSYKGIPFYIKASYYKDVAKDSHIDIWLNIVTQKPLCASVKIQYDYDIYYIKNLKKQLDDNLDNIKYNLGLIKVDKQYIVYVKGEDRINLIEEEGYIQEDKTLGKRNTAKKFKTKQEAHDLYDYINHTYNIYEYEVEEI